MLQYHTKPRFQESQFHAEYLAVGNQSGCENSVGFPILDNIMS